MSVAAENVVGVGAARTCTTQTISESPLTSEIMVTTYIINSQVNSCKTGSQKVPFCWLNSFTMFGAVAMSVQVALNFNVVINCLTGHWPI